MARYIYKGAFQARSIQDGNKTIFDGNLVPDKTYDNLPESNAEIAAMIVGGLLVPVEENLSDLSDKAKATKKETK